MKDNSIIKLENLNELSVYQINHRIILKQRELDRLRRGLRRIEIIDPKLCLKIGERFYDLIEKKESELNRYYLYLENRV